VSTYLVLKRMVWCSEHWAWQSWWVFDWTYFCFYWVFVQDFGVGPWPVGQIQWNPNLAATSWSWKR